MPYSTRLSLQDSPDGARECNPSDAPPQVFSFLMSRHGRRAAGAMCFPADVAVRIVGQEGNIHRHQFSMTWMGLENPIEAKFRWQFDGPSMTVQYAEETKQSHDSWVESVQLIQSYESSIPQLGTPSFGPGSITFGKSRV